MSLRVAANLAAFALLSLALAWWAATNYVTFGLTEAPAHDVTLEFSSSPGLQVGFEVAYLGHAVGSIERVRLQDDRVLVDAAIEPDAGVPAEVGAQVRRKSAVGEPYVDLAPRGRVDADGPRLADGDVIALEHTDVPLSYEEVFGSVAEVLEAVPTDAAGTIVHELATALEGREDELQALAADGQEVLATAAARADLLDSLATESTRLAGVLADLAPTAGRALDDLQPLVAAVADARAEIVALLETSPDLTTRVADLVLDARAPVGCLLGSLERSLAEVDTPENAERLRYAIDRAPTLMALLRASTHDRDSGPWLRVDPILNNGGDPVREYPHPLPYPDREPAPRCGEAPALDAPTATTQQAPPSAEPLDLDDVDDPVRTVTDGPTAGDDTTDDRASSDLRGGGGWLPPAWLVALVALAVLVATRPWRLLRRGRR